MDQFRTLSDHVSIRNPDYYCKVFVPLLTNRSNRSYDQQAIPNYMGSIFKQNNLTLNSFSSVPECVKTIRYVLNMSSETNTSIDIDFRLYPARYSKSLMIFVTLIALVSIVSILGNLFLAKVLYAKRRRMIQTDRIVLCLALSELCLVLIDTPTEIYRLLSPSFSYEWLCRFHTFFEALFSACIIFYHLLGALDRFVYIRGHTCTRSSWTIWSHRLSTKTGSTILLTLPLLLSLPLAICNTIHAHIVQTSLTSQACHIQYNHGILISLLVFFYFLPIVLAFILHGKLIYLIRTRHNQYFLHSTAYILPLKRNHLTDSRTFPRKKSPNRRLMFTNTETLNSTSMTLSLAQCQPLHPNTSSNSSQSSRSSTATSSTSITSPVVLYKINSQANANANRTVLLLVLLLSFYVFCWAPYNIYTWKHAYDMTQSNPVNLSRLSNETNWKELSMDFQSSLRRFVYISYSLFLLSMISMCFSFIFYFCLNKQARLELSRFLGCFCPWMTASKKRPPSKQLQYQARGKKPPSTEFDQRHAHKRTVLNYGCQVQCCQ